MRTVLAWLRVDMRPSVDWAMKKIDRTVYYASGEFLLKRRANGGTLVFVRSSLVTLCIILAVLPIKSYCKSDTVLVFSGSQLKTEIGDLLPWIGAIFAATYAAFYARFSAQWNYLASLYNQIMAASVTAPPTAQAAKRMAAWRAALIEDAIDLHLARKSMFKSAITEYLRDHQDVVDAFFSGTDEAGKKAAELAQEWKFTVLTPTPTPAPPPAPVPNPGNASQAAAPALVP